MSQSNQQKHVYRLIFLQRSSEYRDVNSRNINIVLIIQQRSSAACIFSFFSSSGVIVLSVPFSLNPYTRILSNLVAKKETKLSVNKVHLWINLAAQIVQLNSDTAAASLSSHPAGISEKRCTFARVKSQSLYLFALTMREMRVRGIRFKTRRTSSSQEAKT